MGNSWPASEEPGRGCPCRSGAAAWLDGVGRLSSPPQLPRRRGCVSGHLPRPCPQGGGRAEEAVANWLYGVAQQTAVRLRATAAKRGRRETQVVNMPEPTVPEVRDADLQAVVDEELSRLPDHYRGVVVLCDLEGMTRKEAARQLGIPEGSVASRLARARAMLAKRLTQRGVVISSGSVAAVLSAGSARRPPRPLWWRPRSGPQACWRQGRRRRGVSAKVAALTEGVLKAMFMTKIKSVLAVMLVVRVYASPVPQITGVTQDFSRKSVS